LYHFSGRVLLPFPQSPGKGRRTGLSELHGSLPQSLSRSLISKNTDRTLKRKFNNPNQSHRGYYKARKNYSKQKTPSSLVLRSLSPAGYKPAHVFLSIYLLASTVEVTLTLNSNEPHYSNSPSSGRYSNPRKTVAVANCHERGAYDYFDIITMILNGLSSIFILSFLYSFNFKSCDSEI